MDLERLIPLLVIYVIWRLISRPRRQKPQQETMPRPENRGMKILRQLITDEFDQEGPKPVLKKRVEGMIRSDAEKVAFMETAPAPSEPPDFLQVDVREAAPERKPPQPDRGKKPCPKGRRRRAFNRRALKKAVIWSELLAKPLALRDDHR